MIDVAEAIISVDQARVADVRSDPHVGTDIPPASSSPEGAPIHRIALPPNLLSIRRARRFAADLVADVDAVARDDVVLIVSELVTNAVFHGGPHDRDATIGLSVALYGDRVRIEIEDAGGNVPVVRDGALDRPTGRGLILVESLAMRWGHERSEAGKVVWAEVAVSAAMASKGGDRHGR